MSSSKKQKDCTDRIKITPPHICLGRTGEHLAAEIFRSDGYEILARNWHYGHLELDLICGKNNQIVFVEVKTRSGAAYGGAAAAITAAKKKKLVIAAQAWLGLNELTACPCRFDVICLVRKDGLFEMEHYKNAFDIARIMDNRHTHWQYW